jgi:hypothetical protein
VWIPLVILIVALAGAFTVSRLHGMFGSDDRPSYTDSALAETKPFDPKHLKYEVFGAPGTVATISYFDAEAEPRVVRGASLPWSLEFEIGSATAVASIIVQGDSDSIGCRILVDDEVKADKTSNQTNAFASCMLEAA